MRGLDPGLPGVCGTATQHVIAGFDPAIHDESQRRKSVLLRLWHLIMDARVEPAHDD
jgi:hypothetical protein